jgi:hypothetical protein
MLLALLYFNPIPSVITLSVLAIIYYLIKR